MKYNSELDVIGEDSIWYKGEKLGSQEVRTPQPATG